MEVKLIQKKSSGVGRGLGCLRPLHNAERFNLKDKIVCSLAKGRTKLVLSGLVLGTGWEENVSSDNS